MSDREPGGVAGAGLRLVRTTARGLRTTLRSRVDRDVRAAAGVAGDVGATAPGDLGIPETASFRASTQRAQLTVGTSGGVGVDAEAPRTGGQTQTQTHAQTPTGLRAEREGRAAAPGDGVAAITALLETLAHQDVDGSARATRREPVDRRVLPPVRPMRSRTLRTAVGAGCLVLLVVAAGGLVTASVLQSQDDTRAAARQVPGLRAAPAPAPGRSGFTGPRIAVVTDTGTVSAGASDLTWPEIVQAGGSVDVVPVTADGAGFAVAGSSGRTLADLADRVPRGADTVFLFGSSRDASASPISVARGGTLAIAAVRKRAPGARIVVLGPVLTGGASETALRSLRDALRTAARIGGARWIDPAASRWLGADRPGAVRTLTAADQRAIAGRIQRLLGGSP